MLNTSSMVEVPRGNQNSELETFSDDSEDAPHFDEAATYDEFIAQPDVGTMFLENSTATVGPTTNNFRAPVIMMSENTPVRDVRNALREVWNGDDTKSNYVNAAHAFVIKNWKLMATGCAIFVAVMISIVLGCTLSSAKSVAITKAALSRLLTEKCALTLVLRDEYQAIGLRPNRDCKQLTKYLNSAEPIIIIEHTATDACRTNKTCTEEVETSQQHEFNFLMGGDKRLYEGTGFYSMAYAGYNCALKIAFIGNYTRSAPNKALSDAVQCFLDASVKIKLLKPTYVVKAASELTNTTSPGAALEKQIKDTWARHKRPT